MTGAAPCPACSEARAIRINVASVDVDAIDKAAVLDRIGGFVRCGSAHVVHQVSVDPVVCAARDLDLRDALDHADLNVADSVGVTWALRRLGDVDLGRIPGAEVMEAVINWGVDDGVRHAFIGSTPSTVAELEATVCRRFPDVTITDGYSPPFREVTEAHVEEDLSVLRIRPDVLWVGLGTPKQQAWADVARQHDAASVIVTVGAAFAFLAGTQSRGPRALQEHGLEWLYRLGSEPRRLWRRYLVGNPKFVVAVERQRRRQAS